MKRLVATIGIYLALCSSYACAVEPICPDGVTPRADITECIDFDAITNCTTGREDTCWEDNDLTTTDRDDAFRHHIIECDAVVGSGCLEGRPIGGGTGLSQFTRALPDGPYSAVNYRYYVKYADGWQAPGVVGHGPSLNITGTDCSHTINLEMNQISPYIYAHGNCAPDTFNLYLTDSMDPWYNNRWSVVEMHVTMDTSCSDQNDLYGCNGAIRIWIDEELVIERTDLNLGGVKKNASLENYNVGLTYYTVRLPDSLRRVQFDNIAISDTGTYIGPASSENSRGTADTSSPYVTYVGIEPFFENTEVGSDYYGLGVHPEGDCSKTTAELNIPSASGFFRSGADNTSRSDDVNKGGITRTSTGGDCDDSYDDLSLKIDVDATADGGGVFFERIGRSGVSVSYARSHSIRGWIYLAADNDYSQSPALSGWRSYADDDDGNCGNYIALSVFNGKWAVTERQRATSQTPAVVAATTIDATAETWTEFEIIIFENNTVSLAINGEWEIEAEETSYSLSYLFADWPLPGTNGPVLGVIEFKGTPPFTAYYDNVQIGSASHFDCTGWGNSCPFTGEPTPTPTPTITETPTPTITETPTVSPTATPDNYLLPEYLRMKVLRILEGT